MIEVKDFAFRYREGASPAISDVNLSIPDGAFVGVTGAAGSGKSTLTYALNGIIPHCYPGDFYGSVTIDGLDTCECQLTDVSRLVGSVCQDIDSQMVSTVVEDEMLFGLENFGMPKGQIANCVSEALQAMGIEDLRDRTIDSLSGGQKQKVAIASILAMRPRVLVLDEPTAELDPASSVVVFDLLAKYAREHGTTVVVVEQKIALLSDYADMLVVMENGRVRFAASPVEVLEHADELLELGVNCPRSTTLMNRLRAAGAYAGPVCRNVSQAARAIGEILGAWANVPRESREAGESGVAGAPDAPSAAGENVSRETFSCDKDADAASGPDFHDVHRNVLYETSERGGGEAAAGAAGAIARDAVGARDEVCASESSRAAVESDGGPVIEFQQVNAAYEAELPILRDVSFSVRKGEFVAFLGTNGAGKSTTMRLVNGLLKPTSGQVLIEGVPTTSLKTSQLAAKVGFLFQNPDRQICCNTVRDELLFGLRAVGADPEDAAARVDAVIEEFGFEPDADPFLLNRGARQLLALASVVVAAPPVVVLDEPTTGLDFRECCKVMSMVGKLRAAGTTVLMVCHDMEVVADFAERVIVMNAGQVVADGATFDVLRDRAVCARASLIPPQVVGISQALPVHLPALARANTLDEMETAVLTLLKGDAR